MPITKPPYQVLSVDVTPEPPIFSLVTTFNDVISAEVSVKMTWQSIVTLQYWYRNGVMPGYGAMQMAWQPLVPSTRTCMMSYQAKKAW